MGDKVLTANFEHEKDTKRTSRFTETVETEIIGTLYVKQSALAKIGNPKKLKVTIEAA